MAKPLNQVMRGFWQLYVGQNYERDRFRLFARVIEVTAHFRRAISYPATLATSERRLAHVFAWYCAVLQELDIDDLEAEVWKVYPRICPFCTGPRCSCPPHEVRGLTRMDEVSSAALRTYPRKPKTLDDWQLMFFDIYGDRVLAQSGRRRRSRPGSPSDAMVGLFNELIEHLGRLAAALRLAPFARVALREELVHFFGWICVTANALGPAYGRDGLVMLSAMLDASFVDGRCDVCRESVCVCRPKPFEEVLAQEGIVDSVYDVTTGVLGAHAFRRDYRLFRRNLGRGPAAIIAFDCDELKRVNDQWDHSAGNAYLKAISEVVARLVGARGTVYRVTSGDEFAVLLPGLPTAEAEQLAVDVVTRLRVTRVPVPSDAAAELYASATLGVATTAALADDQSDLFQVADQALMRGKKLARGAAFAPGGRRLGAPAVAASDALYPPASDDLTRPNALPEA